MNLDTKGIAQLVAASVIEIVTPLLERIKHLEARTPERGEKGDPGERGEPGLIGEKGIQGDRGEMGEKGERGEIGERGLIGPAGEKGAQGENGEQGQKGDQGEPGQRGEPGPVGIGEKGERGEPGEPGPRGEPGSDGHAGANGTHGARGEKGESGDQGPPGEPGSAGPAGKNLTIDDVRDFLDAGMAKWMLDSDRLYRKHVDDFIAALPKPKDGVDGLPIDAIKYDHEMRSIVFIRDEIIVHELKLYTPRYEGVWHEGSYEMGLMVTFGGNLWSATKDTEAKPGTNGDWILCVKKGRDGRDLK